MTVMMMQRMTMEVMTMRNSMGLPGGWVVVSVWKLEKWKGICMNRLEEEEEEGEEREKEE